MAANAKALSVTEVSYETEQVLNHVSIGVAAGTLALVPVAALLSGNPELWPVGLAQCAISLSLVFGGIAAWCAYVANNPPKDADEMYWLAF